MRKLFGTVVAVLAFAGVANATDLPFVPDCRMEYTVASVNAVLGLGGGTGTVICQDKYKGETSAEVDILVTNFNAVGILQESGVIYAAGLGLNKNTMLGVLMRAQAAAALGKYGAHVGAGVMINSGPSVQVYLDHGSSKGIGGAFGYGAWFFAEAGQGSDVIDDGFWHNQ